uniref:restriction endonuclease subunit S n=1 Tax=Segatella hominis TaxID=2518605 RepID=UPI004026FBCB
MKRYDEYKDSGVEWIGEVPRHWEVVRTRYLCNLCTGNKDTINRVDDGKFPFYVRSPKVERINTYSFDGEAILMAGDGVGAGKVFHYANGKFDYHQRVYNFHNFKKVIGKFFYYYITNNFRYIIEEGGAKNTVDSVRLYMIQNFLITVPPKEEQREIVFYLDKKCSEIDNVISAQQKRIALLQELKQSVITHAVTKGLNPNVEMKDSGVEWIGKIPASWDVVHLKRILRERMQYGANEPAESDDTTYPRYIRITDITANGELRPETFKSLEPSTAKDYLLDKGDVLFARSGATVGKTFLFNADIKACYAGYLIKASCDKRRMLPEYLYYYTQSGAYECWKNSVFIQSTIQNIGADKYQMMYIPVPSKDEQKQIVEYTMRKSQIFDAAISKAQHQVELLQEYKQSLITEVVTGKRKVS